MAALDWSQCPAVESVPEKVSGAWVFRGTRMPVAAVFENLEDGLSIDDLVELYDGLTREQVQAVLEFAARSLQAPSPGELMLVLFDQGTPVPIAKFLLGHAVKTARQQGWDTLVNGELLRVAEEAGFDVLVTTDKNLIYQQNLKARKIAIVVLGRNRWSIVKLAISQIVAAVNASTPGSYVIVNVPGA